MGLNQPDGIIELKGKVNTHTQTHPFLTQKLSPVDNHLQMIILFSPRESHWENKLCMSSSK